jgi:RNA polymerase sigma factor (sigma-70 family)
MQVCCAGPLAVEGGGRSIEMGLWAAGGGRLDLARVSRRCTTVAVTTEGFRANRCRMTDANRHDGDALLAAARLGRREFTAFYRHFERPMLGFFMSATGRPELVADLTAETFARALESVEAFDSARGRADQWLFGIARNVLGESYRRGRVEAAARARLGLPKVILDDHAADAIERLSSEHEPAAVALGALPGEQRQAIEARVLDEREYPEIAQELRCSEALVRQRVSRGLRTLRTRLAGER